jgi:DNA polymerase
MDGRASPSLADQLAAANDWWRDAGVDCIFNDETARWLRDPEEEPADAAAQAQTPAPAPVIPAAPKITIGGDPTDWPKDVDSFAAWWLTEPSLDFGGTRPRVAPRGKAGAKLMVLVAAPEAEDNEKLLSGPQGSLLASFLSAAGMAEEEAYVAAGLPRHIALADMPALAEAGLRQITMHHIELVAPERVLVFGRDVLPLIGHDPAQNQTSLENINHEQRSFPLLVDRNLELMLQRPATRSRFWQRWLDWTG